MWFSFQLKISLILQVQCVLNIVFHKAVGFYYVMLGFPGGASGKEPACQCRKYNMTRVRSGAGRSRGGGHGNLLQYFCLENPMDRGAWWAAVHSIAKVGHD